MVWSAQEFQWITAINIATQYLVYLPVTVAAIGDVVTVSSYCMSPSNLYAQLQLVRFHVHCAGLGTENGSPR